MKPKPCKILEDGRVKHGPLASDESYGNNGAFTVRGPKGRTLNIIISDGAGWEHASVSYYAKHIRRCPVWDEMHWVKTLVWRDDECVMQLHPPQADYVNCHPYTLHLWKPIGQEIPRPPSILVGLK